MTFKGGSLIEDLPIFYYIIKEIKDYVRFNYKNFY